MFYALITFELKENGVQYSENVLMKSKMPISTFEDSYLIRKFYTLNDSFSVKVHKIQKATEEEYRTLMRFS